MYIKSYITVIHSIIGINTENMSIKMHRNQGFNQRQLCDVSSSWSAIRLHGAAPETTPSGARQAISTLEKPVTY